MKTHLLLFLAVAFVEAQIESTAKVKTAYGPITLSHMRVLRSQSSQIPCGFAMNIENTTGVGWDSMEFLAKVSGTDVSEVPWSMEFPVTVQKVGGDSMQAAFSGCNGSFSYATVDKFSISLVRGTPVASEVAAFQRTESGRVAERKRASEAAAARASSLAKLPTLISGTSVAFMGADRKCAMQFQDALRMDGLEKRKRLADLVSFGCGFLADVPMKVQVVQKEGDYVLVNLADGKQNGKSGWVPVSWVK